MTERPDRYKNAIVPHIYVDGASDAIAFYTRAFGAVELFRVAHPDGRIVHAEISICGSVVLFYGASSASVRDPFGHVWVLLSWQQNLDPAEIERRGMRSSASERRAPGAAHT